MSAHSVVPLGAEKLFRVRLQKAGVTRIKRTALAAMLVLSPEYAVAQEQIDPEFVGSWAGPWDYAAAVDPTNCASGLKEFSHAALIPIGRYAGYAMLVSRGCNGVTTEVWLFNPNNPAEVLEVDQILASNVFCGGMSWENTGTLLSTGGLPSGGLAKFTYRFDPTVLRRPIYPFGGGTPIVKGNPWTQIGDMSCERWYPTLIALARAAIASACDSAGIGGSSHLVLSGPTASNLDNTGNELYQFMDPTLATWSRTLKPAGPPTTHSFIGASEDYTLVPAYGQSGAPSHLLDSYARAFQLGEPNPSGGSNVNGQILVVNDIDTGFSPAAPPNEEGASWAFKPPASTTSGCFEVRSGPNSNSVGARDHHYGTTVLLHKAGVRNRVLAFGGSHAPNAGTRAATDQWQVTNSVEEYVPASDTEPVSHGQWRSKTPLSFARTFANAVATPTGEILVVGGDGIDDKLDHNPQGLPSLPRFRPELYDPGLFSISAGSTTLMIASNVVTPPGQSTPRLYHSVALLLADGRILLAGGEQPNLALYPDSKYTAELFYPPYLFRGTQPAILGSPASVSMNGTPFAVDAKVFNDHVARVVVTRPAAVTHDFDTDQRYVELEFSVPTYTPSPSGVTITISVTPPHESWCPPGYYMLWVVESTDGSEDNNKLVPSDAKFLSLN